MMSRIKPEKLCSPLIRCPSPALITHRKVREQHESVFPGAVTMFSTAGRVSLLEYVYGKDWIPGRGIAAGVVQINQHFWPVDDRLKGAEKAAFGTGWHHRANCLRNASDVGNRQGSNLWCYCSGCNRTDGRPNSN